MRLNPGCIKECISLCWRQLDFADSGLVVCVLVRCLFGKEERPAASLVVDSSEAFLTQTQRKAFGAGDLGRFRKWLTVCDGMGRVLLLLCGSA